MRALKMTGFVLGAAAAVLVPIYAAQGLGKVTHPEWAGLLVDALEMETALPENPEARQLFSALSWKDSLAFSADRYLTATGVAVQASGGTQTVVAAQGADGEAAYPLLVITGGDYRVRARVAGSPDRPVMVEMIPSGQALPAGSVTLAPPPAMGWADGGALHLDRGAYSMMVRLPGGTSLANVEVAPPCVSSVEPLRGWSEGAITDAVDLAATVLQAIDKESELPADGAPIDVSAASFQSESVAGPGPRRSVVFLDLPAAGLYTISVRGVVGSGQGWSADACRKAIVCTPLDAAADRGPQWRVLMTAPFNAGRHVFTVTLRDGASVEMLRAEKKKATGADYVATVRALGLDAGPDGPISRGKADEAAAFVRPRAAALLANRCGDIVLPDGALRVAGFQPASIAGPALPPGVTGSGPGPIGNPGVPLDFPAATPTSQPPATTPTAPPTAAPASPPPAPTATPTPPVIPPQPPGSAVTPTPAP
jgi:hypothetical protein